MRTQVIIFLFIVVLCSCDKLITGTDPDSNETECFNILWNNFDLHYPSFILKNINWDSVKDAEMPQVATKGLYAVLTDVGKILKDCHYEVKTDKGRYIEPPFPWINRISNSPIKIPGYVTLQPVYNDKIQYGTYGNIGYISIKDFGLEKKYYNQVAEIVSTRFKDKEGIIIDIRDNPGGNSSNGDIIAGRFTDKELLCYRFIYRDGPKHTDLGSTIEHYIEPGGDFQFVKPVAVLINKRSSSASEMFCLCMRRLPNVFIVGDTTSGTITDNEYQELPNGWVYRMSVGYLVTPDNEIFEGKGIPPDYPVWNPTDNLISGRDLIFEKAVDLIENKN